MPRVIITLLIVAVWIYALIDCLRSDADEVRGVPKGVWIVVLVLLPVLGAVLWFALGRPRFAAPAAPGRPGKGAGAGGPLGPDDDPQFLRNLEQQRRNQAEARRLEELKKKLEEKERRLRDGEDGAPGQNGTGPSRGN